MAPGLFFRTLPYVLLRFGAHLLFGLVLALFLALMGGVGWLAARLFGSAALPLAVVALAALVGAWALSVFAHRYVLYLVRAGHWLTRSRPARVVPIPGAGVAVGLAARVLGLAANYVDEAVMSHIVSHEDRDPWEAAAGGVVLYVRCWKSLLGTAAVLAVLIGLSWLACFLLCLFPLLGVARSLTPEPALRSLYGFIGLAAAMVAATAVKWAVADPMATVAMVASFAVASRGQVASRDVRPALLSVSGRFRRLTQGATSRAGLRVESGGGPDAGGDGRGQA